MGSACTVGTTPLPDPKKVISGTDIPEWVSAAGRRLYEQSEELATQDFPEYTGPRIATYGEDGSKLTEREQTGLDLLAEGTDSFQSYLDNAETMAGTLGGGFNAGTFTAGDPNVIVGESFQAPTFQDSNTFDRTFEYDQFNPDMARQYQNIFQTSVDPALEELNRQRDLRQTQNSADAIRAGAFGGSRLGLREATTDAEIARAGSDLRRQAGREGLQFATQRYDTDRTFDANRFDTDRRNFEADRAYDRGAFESDRAFDASRFDADRAARFGAEDQRRAGFETAEAARLRGFETDEASRLRAAETLQSFAPLAQSLQEQAASGLLTAGQAQRQLDQRALDLAYGDYLEQRQYPQEQLNFALGALQGVPYNTRTIGLEQGMQYAQTPSIYGQTIGGLGSLASAYYLANR